MSLGRIVSDARKAANLSPESLAAQIRREDGRSISAKYIRDLEHDRIQAPSDFFIEQLSIVLNVPRETLYYYAGRIPGEIARLPADENRVATVFNSIRKLLGKDRIP